jgi:hypothetical protein
LATLANPAESPIAASATDASLRFDVTIVSIPSLKVPLG